MKLKSTILIVLIFVAQSIFANTKNTTDQKIDSLLQLASNYIVVDYEKMLEVSEKAVFLTEKTNNIPKKVEAYSLIAKALLGLKQLDRASYYIDKGLKEDYAKTIVKSYKSRSEQNRIMFILSSENFLQAYKRMQYIKQYAKYRKSQGDEIREKFEELERISAHLEIQKSKQEKIAKEPEEQRKELQGERNKQNELMTLVKKDSKKYSDQIRKKQQETKKIEQQIKESVRKMIEEENRKRREEEERKAKAAGKTVAPKKSVSSTRLEMTPEEKALAASFSNNRGRLPWPVEKGYISTKYGTIRHPEYENVQYESHGIEITSEQGATVRSVFEGVVSEIQIIGNSKAVLIRHGEYISVYQNLSSVSVKAGQKVSTKQKIGTVGINFEGKPVIKFMVMKNTEFNNPQSWLSSK